MWTEARAGYFVTWAWPNHQPYAYLLIPQENPPINMWLHEPLADGSAGYQEHWLDPQPYFSTQGETAEFIYIITEPDTLPLPHPLQNAEK